MKLRSFTLLLFVLVLRGALSQGPPTTRIGIGAIVGAQYISENARFFIYAEPSSGPVQAELWRDEVVEIARAWFAVGPNYGFSLDFVRRGTKEFKPDDIYDLSGIERRLAEADAANPVFMAIRTRLGPVHIPATASKPSKQELRRLTDALNHIMADPSLVPTLCDKASNPDFALLLKDGCDKRLARLIIEDFVGRSVSRDIEPSYVINYKPALANVDLQRIFSSSRAEAVLLSGDTWLKTLAGDGGQIPPGLAVGPSEVNLCGEEAMNVSQTGSDIPNGERAEHFSLVLDYANAPALPGKVIWFTNQRLIVTTGSAPEPQPDCSDRFAASLTKNLARIANYDGPIGSDLRNLLVLLELARAIDYFAALSDIDEEYLLTIPTDRILNIPPPVMDTPVRFAAGGRALGYRSYGGVILSGDPFSRTPGAEGEIDLPGGEYDPVEHPLIDPGFVVKAVEVGGTRLLRIDISSILRRTANVRNEGAAE